MQQRQAINIDFLLSNKATFEGHELNANLNNIIKNTPTFTTKIKFQALVDEYGQITYWTDDCASTNLNNSNATNVNVEEPHDQAMSKQVLDNLTSMGIKTIIVDRVNNTALLQFVYEAEADYALMSLQNFNQVFQNKRGTLGNYFLENKSNLYTCRKESHNFIRLHSQFKLCENKSMLDLLTAILVHAYSAADIHFLFQIDVPKDQSYNPNLHEDENVTDLLNDVSTRETIKGKVKIAYTKNIIKLFTDPEHPEDLNVIKRIFNNKRNDLYKNSLRHCAYQNESEVQQAFRVGFSSYVCTISINQSDLIHSKTMLDFVKNLLLSEKPIQQKTTTMRPKKNHPTSGKRKRDDKQDSKIKFDEVDNNTTDIQSSPNITNSPNSFFTLPASPPASPSQTISSEELEAAIKGDPELKRLLIPSSHPNSD